MQILDPYDVQSYSKSIDLLYSKIPGLKITSFTDRVAMISALLIGRPYVLGPNGEGPLGQFDQAPLYRLDAFDCVTYVNTVLALALSQDVLSFEKNLIRIAYQREQLSYAYRNHFISVDWNLHNQSMGIIEEKTASVARAISEDCLKTAVTLIDRPSWFRRRNFNDIRLLRKVSAKEMKQLLGDLRGIAKTVKLQQSQLNYLPIQALFDHSAQPIISYFRNIPHASIIELVRPNWNLKKKIGTNINVSHIGFAIWQNDQLFYRQASAIEKCVIDIPLSEYLRCRLVSPTIKGISLYGLTNR